MSYPEALSENLTSKRTSHKIAEQGRRNRINTALQEIAALLPQVPISPDVRGKDVSAGEGTPNGTANGSAANGTGAKGKSKERTNSIGAGAGSASASSSKANTVEMAIEYIRALHGELRDVKGRLEVAERRLGERESTGLSSDGSRGEGMAKTVEIGVEGKDIVGISAREGERVDVEPGGKEVAG